MDVKPTEGIARSLGDEAVSQKTGKNWDQWFSQLDRAGARRWDHKATAGHLLDACGVPGWWAQKIAAAYEEARGLAAKPAQISVYQIQRSRTIAVPAPKAWAACAREERRLIWFPEATNERVRSVREDTRLMLRLDAPDGSSILIAVTPQDGDKCLVEVKHSKLPNRAATRRAKQDWAERLGELQKYLTAD
jgi:uncharacterized protein YndB with AHSA1/START domain